MENFSFENPTKLIFGKGQVKELANEVPKYAKKVLLVYGGGSIVKNGIYDEVTRILSDISVDVYELSGVEANPKVETVGKGAKICKDRGVELVLAVGGGSAIDCAKAIAITAVSEHDIWDFATKKATPEKALPIGTVLTVAGTASEMNAGMVITRSDIKEKRGFTPKVTFPKFSILDPSYTKTVPDKQTVYGIVDMMSHVMEQYFHRAENTPIQDEFAEGILRTLIDVAPRLRVDLRNYEYRETVMLSGTLAFNGLLSMGQKGDWATHNIAHAIASVHDLPHGACIGIVYPHWLMYVLEEGAGRISRLAVNVFGVDAAGKNEQDIAIEGIEALKEFWNSLGAPQNLGEFGIGMDTVDEMTEKTTIVREEHGNFVTIDDGDAYGLIKASLE